MIDPITMSIIDQVEQFQKTRPDAWNIPRAEGMLLHALIRAGQCRTLVEVGTSYGFSGLFLGSAAKANGGVLHTYEIDTNKCQTARKHFVSAGLDSTIHLHQGDARQLLEQLHEEIDFAFIDAAKPQTLDYWRIIEPKLAKRCIVTLDNIDDPAEELQGFVRLLQSRQDFTACDVNIGNGFELAVRG